MKYLGFEREADLERELEGELERDRDFEGDREGERDLDRPDREREREEDGDLFGWRFVLTYSNKRKYHITHNRHNKLLLHQQQTTLAVDGSMNHKPRDYW